MEMVSEFVWLLEDSPHFIAGRATAAIRRYLDDLLPPLANAMVKVGESIDDPLLPSALPTHQHWSTGGL